MHYPESTFSGLGNRLQEYLKSGNPQFPPRQPLSKRIWSSATTADTRFHYRNAGTQPYISYTMKNKDCITLSNINMFWATLLECVWYNALLIFNGYFSARFMSILSTSDEHMNAYSFCHHWLGRWFDLGAKIKSGDYPNLNWDRLILLSGRLILDLQILLQPELISTVTPFTNMD